MQCPLGLAAALAATLTVTTASAERPGDVLVRLDLDAVASCATEERFKAELGARAPDVHFTDDSGAQLVAIDIEKTETGSVGELTLVGVDGERSTREVVAANCEEAVHALALVTSLALDRRAPAKSAAPADPEPARKRAKTAEPSEGWLPIAEQDRSVNPYRAAFGPSSPRGWWGIGMHATAVAGALPRTGIGPRLFVDARLEGSGILSPSARLSATRVVQTVGVDGENARLSWTTGRADLCPIAVPFVEGHVFPCGAFELGWSFSPDTTTLGDSSYATLWIAPGALARAQWALVDVILVELEAGLVVPLERDRGVTESGEALYTAAPIALFSGVGVGGRFP